jgi:hypothetical protein
MQAARKAGHTTHMSRLAHALSPVTVLSGPGGLCRGACRRHHGHGGLGGVHDLQPVDVLDLAVRPRCAPVTACAVAHHVHLERRAQGQADHHGQRWRPGWRCTPAPAAATRGAGSAACPVLGQRVLRGVAHQAARVAHLVHHGVADVGAGAAADAFVLQAVADVDAGRADLHAQLQSTQAPRFSVAGSALRERAPRGSPRSVS